MDDITKITSSQLTLTLQRLNVCRMYLQVTLLSEITDIQGHQITSSATREVRNPNQKSTLQWPLQKCPDTITWNLWRFTIQKIYFRDSSRMFHQYFRLQQWLQSSPEQLTQYTFQYSPANNEIYHQENGIISHHYTCNHTRNSATIALDTENYCSILPKDCIPIDSVNKTIFKVFTNHKVSIHQSKADYSFKSSISQNRFSTIGVMVRQWMGGRGGSVTCCRVSFW